MSMLALLKFDRGSIRIMGEEMRPDNYRVKQEIGVVMQDVAVFNEPTVAVDPQSRNQILEGICELNRQGSTIIYTSHYMEEVEQICTRIAIMDHGRCIASGTKEELKKNFSRSRVNSSEIECGIRRRMSVRKAAQFFPVYWYERVNNLMAEYGGSAGLVRAEILQGIGIQLVFAAAFICITMAVSRQHT